MNKKNLHLVVALLLISGNVAIFSQPAVKPANPKTSPEATALLNYIYSISGKYILTGQHNYPNIKDRNSRFAADYIGKTPAIFSTDMGFERDGNTDSYLARPDIVQEAIRQHKAGAIITICWHAVPPTADEPVTFRPLPDAKPDSLASIQGQLTDQQFKDVLTPGTKLYKKWCAQVDSVAKYLKMLEHAKVPVLWRPYHEMNGSWFWWGGRLGKYSTIALYKQLFNRIVNIHKINNLVWVWNIDRPSKETMQFKNFYPGTQFLDILSLDVYGNDFKQDYYDKLISLSEGKPLIFGEVGNPPAPEIMQTQPKWASYVVWAGMVRNTSKKQYDTLSKNGRVLYQEDRNYHESLAPYRKACNLPLLEMKPAKPANFSGIWVFNEDKSILGNSGASSLPYKLNIAQQANSITIKKTFLVEFAANRTDTITLSLNGTELITEFWNSPMTTSAILKEGSDTLEINSKVIFTRGGQTSEMVTRENWELTNEGKTLLIRQFSKSFWGERNVKMVFDLISID